MEEVVINPVKHYTKTGAAVHSVGNEGVGLWGPMCSECVP